MNAIIVIIILLLILIVVLFVRSEQIQSLDETDIIIVGLGTAGSILARRLNDLLPDKKILVLERGTDQSWNSVVYNPLNALTAAYDPKYSTLIKPDNPNVTVTVAKMFGGCSSHNFGLTVHGSPRLYNDEWAPVLGLNYQQLIPYIKRIERYTGISQNLNVRGTDGMIEVSQLPVKIDIASRILPLLKRSLLTPSVLPKAINTLINLGPLGADKAFADIISNSIISLKKVPIVEDYNADVDNCVCNTQQLYVDDVTGLRQSTDVSYLPSYYRWKNIGKLDIISSATVTSLDKTDSELIGVNWSKNGVNKKTLCKRVIVSAGGIYSQFLLLNSNFQGVGKGLTTHYGSQIIMSMEGGSDFSGGPVAFLPRVDGNVRDWQLVVASGPLLNVDLLKSIGVTKTSNLKYFSFLIWMLRPKARGEIVNGEKEPVVKLHMFENQDDVNEGVEQMLFMYKIAQEMRKQLPSIKVVFPPETAFENRDDVIKYMKQGISMTDHYASTCAMGTVVDSNFSLIQDNRISVVDASVFPTIPDGNTEFPTCLMAEIAADRISELM